MKDDLALHKLIKYALDKKNEETKTTWIPVKDGKAEVMPETSCYVWVTRKGFQNETWVQKVWYEADIGRFTWNGVIAWQPYFEPAPYKESEE